MENIDLELLTSQVAALGPLLYILMVIIGVVLVVIGMVRMARIQTGGHGSRTGFTGPMVMVIVGGVMTATASLINIGSGTLGAIGHSGGDQARESVLAGDSVRLADSMGIDPGQTITAGGTQWNLAMAVDFGATVIAIVGFAGFIRGLVMLSAIGNGSAGQGMSFGHSQFLIWGGILAMNVPWTLDVVAGSMGLTAKQMLGF